MDTGCGFFWPSLCLGRPAPRELLCARELFGGNTANKASPELGVSGLKNQERFGDERALQDTLSKPRFMHEETDAQRREGPGKVACWVMGESDELPSLLLSRALTLSSHLGPEAGQPRCE